MEKLVAYFSASGVTAAVAKKIADSAKADLFEIVPYAPYTAADLDWLNSESRSSLEMSDPDSRPEIKNKVDNIRRYDIIFLGFPIWWYVAPTIINSFLETYDLAGKKVILFATSGGSGFGRTVNFLKLSTAAELIEGNLFNGATDKAISDWVAALTL